MAACCRLPCCLFNKLQLVPNTATCALSGKASYSILTHSYSLSIVCMLSCVSSTKPCLLRLFKLLYNVPENDGFKSRSMYKYACIVWLLTIIMWRTEMCYININDDRTSRVMCHIECSWDLWAPANHNTLKRVERTAASRIPQRSPQQCFNKLFFPHCRGAPASVLYSQVSGVDEGLGKAHADFLTVTSSCTVWCFGSRFGAMWTHCSTPSWRGRRQELRHTVKTCSASHGGWSHTSHSLECTTVTEFFKMRWNMDRLMNINYLYNVNYPVVCRILLLLF